MASADIRLELKQLIEQEQDVSVLQAIKTLLSKQYLDSSLKSKLSSRALKAEKNIKDGAVLSPDEMQERTGQFLSE